MNRSNRSGAAVKAGGRLETVTTCDLPPRGVPNVYPISLAVTRPNWLSTSIPRTSRNRSSNITGPSFRNTTITIRSRRPVSRNDACHTHRLRSAINSFFNADAVSDDYGYCPLVEGAESQCRPTVDCAVWFDVVTSSCQLPYGAIGACCPSLPYNSKIINH